jgi:hypothetical protein
MHKEVINLGHRKNNMLRILVIVYCALYFINVLGFYQEAISDGY